jgi:hypothetical protein
MQLNRFLIAGAALCMAGCVTSHVEDDRETTTGLGEGESIVIMAKSYHQGNETEADYITCIEKALRGGSKGLNVVPTLMQRPGVSEAIKDLGVRYIVWLDGDTERVAEGGSLSCAAGPGGGGCFGFAWWQNDADYEASVWDLVDRESAGTVSADVSGTSFLPALVVPIPLIARTQTRACKGLAQQLRAFIVQ